MRRSSSYSTVRLLGFGRIAVGDAYLVSGFLQVLSDVLRDHHRAMLSAGAAEADRQVALPFIHVMRQKIDQQLRDALDELARLGKGLHVADNLGMASGERAKFRNEVRIGKEAD